MVFVLVLLLHSGNGSKKETFRTVFYIFGLWASIPQILTSNMDLAGKLTRFRPFLTNTRFAKRWSTEKYASCGWDMFCVVSTGFACRVVNMFTCDCILFQLLMLPFWFDHLTPGSMNSLFSDFFTEFWRGILGRVREHVRGGFGRFLVDKWREIRGQSQENYTGTNPITLTSLSNDQGVH